MTGSVTVKPDGTLDRSAMAAVTNPADLCAIEAALRLKEQREGARVIAISMGPPQAWSMLHELLAMGCDEAVLVSGREFGGSDTYATSQVLAAAILTIGFGREDIILCGEKSVDGETAQIGGQLAEWLDLPQALRALELRAEKDALYVRCRAAGGVRTIKLGVPCLISCTDKMNVPRYLKVKDILAFDAKPCRTIGYPELSAHPLIETNMIGLRGSPTTVFQPFSLAARGSVRMMEGSEREAVAELFGVWRNDQII